LCWIEVPFTHTIILSGYIIMRRILFVIVLSISLIGHAQQNRFSLLYDFIENTAVFEWNQTEGHTPLIPWPGLSEALTGDPAKSAAQLSLNGTWKFFYAETPEETPAGFYEPGFNDRMWKPIIVPGNWEMQGFGDPLFRNIATPSNPFPPRSPENIILQVHTAPSLHCRPHGRG
jgi:beta-galactosidase